MWIQVIEIWKVLKKKLVKNHHNYLQHEWKGAKAFFYFHILNNIANRCG